MVQSKNVALGTTDDRSGTREQGIGPMTTGGLQTAQDLKLLLKAAQHYAEKLDADQGHTRSTVNRTNYSTTIGKLLTHLENEMAE